MSLLYYHKNVIDDDEAKRYFNYLKWNVQWEDGIRSRIYGITRKAKTIGVEDELFQELFPLITNVLNKINQNEGGNLNLGFAIEGIYLNYYQNGNDCAPEHSHKDSYQLVISLGETRTLQITSKKYLMGNGDAILFGNQKHRVPQEPDKTGERISIATFMRKVIIE